MKVGERGQVTIPKEIQRRFGLGPETEVEFHVIRGSIARKKSPKRLDLGRWRSRSQGVLRKARVRAIGRLHRARPRRRITGVHAILLDILFSNELFFDASVEALQQSAAAGSVGICHIVYAQLFVRFEFQRHCERFLERHVAAV